MASASRSYSPVYHARSSSDVIARIGLRGPGPTNRVEAVRAIERENRIAAARFDLDAGDPRWLLAIQTTTQMQGTALPADGRDRLLRLGHELGLRPFESNMIIAIVQDEARLEMAGGQLRKLTDRLKSRVRIIPNRRQSDRVKDVDSRSMSLPAHPLRTNENLESAAQGISVPAQVAGSVILAAVLFLVVLGWILQT